MAKNTNNNMAALRHSNKAATVEYYNSMVKLSVIIATKNRQLQLRNCIKSILHQRRFSFSYEIIIVDGGSTDSTAELVSRMITSRKQRMPRIRYLYEKNAAASRGRNIGAMSATGRWLAFIDDDCEVGDGWLRHAKNIMRKGVWAGGGPAIVPKNMNYPEWFNGRWESLDLGKISRPLTVDEYPMECNLFIRKEAFTAIGGMDVKLGPSAHRLGFHEGPHLIRKLRAMYSSKKSVWYEAKATVFHHLDSRKITLHGRFVRSYYAGIDHTRSMFHLEGKYDAKPVTLFLQLLGRAISLFPLLFAFNNNHVSHNNASWFYTKGSRRAYRFGEKVQQLYEKLGLENFEVDLQSYKGNWKGLLRAPFLKLWRNLWIGHAFGIPRRIISQKEFSKFKVKTLWVQKDRKIKRLASRCAPGSAHPHLLSSNPAERPDLWLAKLKDAYVHGPSVAITTNNGSLISDVSIEWGKTAQNHGIMRRFILRKPNQLPGRSVVLGCTGGNTYHHWMLDVLPRIRIIKEAGYDINDFDHVILNDTKSHFQRETLEVMGINASKCKLLKNKIRYQCEELYLPSLSAPLGHPSIENISFIKERILTYHSAKKADRMVLVGREPGQSRQVSNWSKLKKTLRDIGFVEYFPATLSVVDQARLFGEAKVVVGVHGSALTNLIFCQRGTRVIELFSREYVNPCYLDLCNVAGLVHHSIIADKGNTSNLRIKLELTDSQSDIQLNIKDTITDIKRILNVAN